MVQRRFARLAPAGRAASAPLVVGLVAAVAFAFVFGVAAADERTPGDADRAPSLSLAEYRALMDGRTAYFYLPSGALWGREYYIPGTNRSVFRYGDGRCLEGRWAKEGDHFCFYYRERPSCWRTFYAEDRLTVFSTAGHLQFIDRIVDDEPLACGPELIG